MGARRKVLESRGSRHRGYVWAGEPLGLLPTKVPGAAPSAAHQGDTAQSCPSRSPSEVQLGNGGRHMYSVLYSQGGRCVAGPSLLFWLGCVENRGELGGDGHVSS